jgi:hypothetical protein
VTCFYDAVNYLCEECELGQFIHSSYLALNPGGMLIFDLNTMRRIQSFGEHGITVAADQPDLFVMYRSWYDEQTETSPLIITGFVRRETQSDHACWHRFDEEHIERSFKLEDIASRLESAGFRVLDLRAFQDAAGRFGGPGDESCERVVFFARKSA